MVYELYPADSAFAAKLGEELQYEQESASEAEPEFVKEFKEQGVWTVSQIFSLILLYASAIRWGSPRHTACNLLTTAPNNICRSTTHRERMK